MWLGMHACAAHAPRWLLDQGLEPTALAPATTQVVAGSLQAAAQALAPPARSVCLHWQAPWPMQRRLHQAQPTTRPPLAPAPAATLQTPHHAHATHLALQAYLRPQTLDAAQARLASIDWPILEASRTPPVVHRCLKKQFGSRANPRDLPLRQATTPRTPNHCARAAQRSKRYSSNC